MPIGISRLLINGTPGDDLLVAQPVPSRLLGGEGNDILIDGPGSDVLIGGAGNNRLYGGLGDDYYLYSYGTGSLDILDVDPTPGNIDTFDFGGSAEDRGDIERRGDDLYFWETVGSQHDATQEDVVIFRNFFLDPAFRIERFRFYGEVLSDKDMLLAFHVDPGASVRHADQPARYTNERIRLSGGEKPDHLTAGDQPTYLNARWGHDLLVGSRFSDVLNAGNSQSPAYSVTPHGSDRMFGGPGGDYYLVDSDWRHAGTSNVEIYDYDTTPGNLDTLQIRGDESPAYIYMRGWDKGDLVIELNTQQRIFIKHYFLDRAFVIEKLRFDDGSVLTEKDIRQRVGLPMTTPQASLSTQSHGEAMTAIEADGWLNLALAAGALLGG